MGLFLGLHKNSCNLSHPYNLLTYYDYIKILDDQPISRSGRVKFVVYQNNNGHKIKIKELPIDWYYESENNPVTLKIHVTGSPNGEPDNTLDFLPLLKQGDSFCKTVKPDRKNVLTGIDISIMPCATHCTSPFSYSQACSTFRTIAVNLTATRASLGSVSL